MDNELQVLVDEDLDFSKEMWQKYSHDKEKMEEVYNRLLFNYADKVEGFSHGLKVVSSYETIAKLTETYRNNVKVLMQRLEVFKNQGYKNSFGMSDEMYEFKKELTNMFNQARFDIEADLEIAQKEKEELIKKIDEIEQITLEKSEKEERWAKLRPFILWISGKTMKGASYVLKILSFVGKEQ